MAWRIFDSSANNTMEQVQFVIKSFNELSTVELYEVLQLRMTVFVVEQNCAYLDLDDKDQESLHVLGYCEGKLAVYARCLPPGLSYEGSSAIGRVVIHPLFRARKWGYTLMAFCVRVCRERFETHKITLSAQHHLQHFYEKCGFAAVGEVYLEDDIPHIKMISN